MLLKKVTTLSSDGNPRLGSQSPWQKDACHWGSPSNVYSRENVEHIS